MYEWPDRPHEPVTAMRVRARITDPAPDAVIPAGTYTVRGKAWPGTGPVAKVELSFTGAGDWSAVRLDVRRKPYAWQDWSYKWTVTRPGRHTLRATCSRTSRRGTG